MNSRRNVQPYKAFVNVRVMFGNKEVEMSNLEGILKTMVDSVQVNEDETANSTANAEQTKRKKKKKARKDERAPKFPLTGYVRFLNEKREQFKSENPTLSFTDVQKILATQWNTLSTDVKALYLDAAEEDKKRYSAEMEVYKKSDDYRNAKVLAKKKKKKDEKHKLEDLDRKGGKRNLISSRKSSVDEPPAKKTNPVVKVTKSNDLFANIDIPIYTDAFLEHNKTCEVELRQLRKTTTEYEEQNAMSQKLTEHLIEANEKLERETSILTGQNERLQIYLNFLRKTFVSNFGNVKLPGVKEQPNLDTVDSYVTNVHGLLLSSTVGHKFAETVRSIISRTNFDG